MSHLRVSGECAHHCTCRTYLRFAAFSSILYIVDCFSFNLHLFDQVAFVSFCFLSLSGPVCVSLPCFLPLPWQWHRPQSVFIFIRWHCCCRSWYAREEERTSVFSVWSARFYSFQLTMSESARALTSVSLLAEVICFSHAQNNEKP